jgi:hypothetical protein
MPAPYEAFEGLQMWVRLGPEICENAGQSQPPAGGCAPTPWLVGDTFQSGQLICEPDAVEVCRDYGSLGRPLHLTGDAIVPGAVYESQVIDCSCDLEDEAAYSAPLTITTSAWCDLVRDCTTLPCTPPDGIVNITTDVTAILDKFKNLPGSVMKVRADVEPNIPDFLVNITDVTHCLDCFLGATYPSYGWAGPTGCP